MSGSAPPIIDFSAARSTNLETKQKLISDIRQACTQCGFFQLINHGVPSDLQSNILHQARELFELPLEVKESYSKDIGGFFRGYERLRAQNFEKRTEGDLKEGWYFGRHLSLDHPSVLARKFGQGPNKYPAEVADPEKFKTVVNQYHEALSSLAKDVLGTLALGLGLDEEWFSSSSGGIGNGDDFCSNPIATLRMLHYPSQAPDASALERGIGAHTDFGAVTLLLQDEVGGLQIWDRQSSSWVDVQPIPGAYVVNLGNMMMRWTNDRYLSNLHRVINKTGQARYSIPFFFNGNPDYVVECLPTCRDPDLGAKYPPITVGEWMTGRYADTYGGADAKEKGIKELSVAEATAAAT